MCHVWGQKLAAERDLILQHAAQPLEGAGRKLWICSIDEAGSTFGTALFEVSFTLRAVSDLRPDETAARSSVIGRRRAHGFDLVAHAKDGRMPTCIWRLANGHCVTGLMTSARPAGSTLMGALLIYGVVYILSRLRDLLTKPPCSPTCFGHIL